MTGTSELALEQAVIHVGARLDKIETSFEEMTERLGRIEATLSQRLGAIDASLATIAGYLDRVDQRIDRIAHRLVADEPASS